MTTDPIRDLLISLSGHMAYMQGQLEARHELDDPEDYYWYRESVLLRQKVTDALADGPAVPEGREPASVTGQPSDGDLDVLMHSIPWKGSPIHWGRQVVRAALTRWGNPAPQPVPVSERLPVPEDCDAKGRCWWLHVGGDGVGDWFQRAPYPSVTSYAFFRMTHWLPAYALPVPGQEVEG